MAAIRTAAWVPPRHWLRWAFWLAFIMVCPGVAQNGPPQPRPHLTPGDVDEGGFPDLQDPNHRNAMMNRERHKNIVRDSDKLLKLAAELDLEIRASGSESLTPVQLRKLADIEKLARSVKEKMSYAVPGPSPERSLPFSNR